MTLSANHTIRPAAPLDGLKATERGRMLPCSAQVWFVVFLDKINIPAFHKFVVDGNPRREKVTTVTGTTRKLGSLLRALGAGAVVMFTSCSITTNVVVSKDVVTVNAHGVVSEKVLKILWFLP